MLRFSRMTDYAVVVLAAMAMAGNEVLPASGLSTRTGVPEPTVAKVLKLLAKGGIITSTRGTSGGYKLESMPKSVRMSEVITAMEGPIALASCVEGSEERCVLENVCSVKGRWDPVNAAIQKALDNVTLADMMPATLTRSSLPQFATRLVVGSVS